MWARITSGDFDAALGIGHCLDEHRLLCGQSSCVIAGERYRLRLLWRDHEFIDIGHYFHGCPNAPFLPIGDVGATSESLLDFRRHIHTAALERKVKADLVNKS